jgi:hypothetical protein
MTESPSISVGILSTFLGAAIYGLIFALPVHAMVAKRVPGIRRSATFLAITLAIFVEFWFAATGCGLAVRFAGAHAGDPSYMGATAAIFVAVTTATFLAGAWMFGCLLEMPREARFANGAFANAVMLLCNGALVAFVTTIGRALG